MQWRFPFWCHCELLSSTCVAQAAHSSPGTGLHASTAISVCRQRLLAGGCWESHAAAPGAVGLFRLCDRIATRVFPLWHARQYPWAPHAAVDRILRLTAIHACLNRGWRAGGRHTRGAGGGDMQPLPFVGGSRRLELFFSWGYAP